MSNERKVIRLEVEIEVDGTWCGDDAAAKAVLEAIPGSVLEIGDDCALLIRTMTAEVL